MAAYQILGQALCPSLALPNDNPPIDLTMLFLWIKTIHTYPAYTNKRKRSVGALLNAGVYNPHTGKLLLAATS